jgi:hypothetical protein
MAVFGESETSEILANYHPRDSRSHVITLRLAHKVGAVFRKLFVTLRKSGFNKLLLTLFSSFYFQKYSKVHLTYEN